MDNTTDILELKFEGNGVNPNVVKASEIGFLIQEFEKAVLSTLKKEHPSVDISEPLLILENIKNESIGLFLKGIVSLSPEIKSLLVGSYLSLTAAISNNDYNNLNKETINSLKSISKFSKKYSCSANFRHNGEYIASITPNTEIKLNNPEYLKGVTTIYGELLDSGGDNPNLHIKINGEYTVIVATDKAIAKSLGSRLYDQVGLKGIAKFDAATSEILEFKLIEVLEYSAGNVAKTFKDLRKLTSGYWDNYNNNDSINRNLLYVMSEVLEMPAISTKNPKSNWVTVDEKGNVISEGVTPQEAIEAAKKITENYALLFVPKEGGTYIF